MNDPLISIQVADVAVSVFANDVGHVRAPLPRHSTGAIIMDVDNVAARKKSCSVLGGR
jgi:hypothetical protein